VHETSGDPQDSLLVDRGLIGIEVRAPERLVVDDRIERERDVRQHEEISQRGPPAAVALIVLHRPDIEDQAEHEHRTEDRPDRGRPRRIRRIHAQRRQPPANQDQQGNSQPERDRDVTDADEREPKRDQPRPVGHAEDDEHCRDGQASKPRQSIRNRQCDAHEKSGCREPQHLRERQAFELINVRDEHDQCKLTNDRPMASIGADAERPNCDRRLGFHSPNPLAMMFR
jgi:hypothetical protein